MYWGYTSVHRAREIVLFKSIKVILASDRGARAVLCLLKWSQIRLGHQKGSFQKSKDDGREHIFLYISIFYSLKLLWLSNVKKLLLLSLTRSQKTSLRSIGYKIWKWNGWNGYLWARQPEVGFHYIQYLAGQSITRVVTPTKVTTKHGSTEITFPRTSKLIIINIRKSSNDGPIEILYFRSQVKSKRRN